MGRGIRETRIDTSNANIVQIVRNGVKLLNYVSISGNHGALTEGLNPYGVDLYGYDIITDLSDYPNPNIIITLSIPQVFANKKLYLTFCTYVYGYDGAYCEKIINSSPTAVQNAQGVQFIGNPYLTIPSTSFSVSLRVGGATIQQGLTIGRLLVGISSMYIDTQ